jgi:5-methylcytosine-specific restriction endonuclease McrA
VPSRPQRPCIIGACHHLATPGQARCPYHQQLFDRQARAHLTGPWRRRSEAIRRDWVAEHGALCVGYQRDAHTVNVGDLTVDHVVARSDEQLAVLCRSCNSRKKDH